MNQKILNQNGQPIPRPADAAGCPIFPQPVSMAYSGATLIDWYAAHAPNEVPDFFRHAPLPLPRPTLENVELSDDAVTAMKDGTIAKTEKGRQEVLRFRTAQDNWDREDQGNRFFQWRFFFAEHSVKLRQRYRSQPIE